MNSLHDKILGCIIGGAIGDYIGCPLEGLRGPLDVDVPADSYTTDDTQLTLATCEAIVDAGQVDPARIAQSMGEWYAAGRITGIGSSTLKALRDISFGAHWAIAGAVGEMSAGNGAAMRIAPLAFCVDPLTDKGRQQVRDVASITHRHEEAILGALAMVVAISTPGYDFIPTVIDALPDSNVRDRLILLAEAEDTHVTDLGIQHGASGYVAKSVPLALVAASRAENMGFLEAVSSVVACGGDTDTTGSMVGQIVGSKIGLSRIPDQLKTLPLGLEPIHDIARCFSEHCA